MKACLHYGNWGLSHGEEEGVVEAQQRKIQWLGCRMKKPVVQAEVVEGRSGVIDDWMTLLM